jgi:DNA-binding beta-propeller fold protein YncE
MWFDPQGHLYIADLSYGRICTYDENGMFLGGWGEEGTQAGQLNKPADVVGDSAGNIYVLEYSGNRVQKFHIK